MADEFKLTPVDNDPFASPTSTDKQQQPPPQRPASGGFNLTPVDYDPFASKPTPSSDASPSLLGEAYRGAARAVTGVGHGIEKAANIVEQQALAPAAEYIAPGSSFASAVRSQAESDKANLARREEESAKAYAPSVPSVGEAFQSPGKAAHYVAGVAGEALPWIAGAAAGAPLTAFAGLGAVQGGAEAYEKTNGSLAGTATGAAIGAAENLAPPLLMRNSAGKSFMKAAAESAAAMGFVGAASTVADKVPEAVATGDWSKTVEGSDVANGAASGLIQGALFGVFGKLHGDHLINRSYDQLFNRLQAGKTTVTDNDVIANPLLTAARDLDRAGAPIQSRDELKEFGTAMQDFSVKNAKLPTDQFQAQYQKFLAEFAKAKNPNVTAPAAPSGEEFGPPLQPFSPQDLVRVQQIDERIQYGVATPAEIDERSRLMRQNPPPPRTRGETDTIVHNAFHQGERDRQIHAEAQAQAEREKLAQEAQAPAAAGEPDLAKVEAAAEADAQKPVPPEPPVAPAAEKPSETETPPEGQQKPPEEPPAPPAAPEPPPETPPPAPAGGAAEPIQAPPAEHPDKVAIDQAAAAADTSPTNAQIEAGNYKKGHVNFQGLDITIENPRGSIRQGVGADGQPWQSALPDHYGYIKKTEGADGDHVDAYIGPDPESRTGFVIDQVDPITGEFDEHKVMLGYSNQQDAINAYHSAFGDGNGPSRFGAVTALPIDGVRAWLESGDTTQPLGPIPPPLLQEFSGKDGKPVYAVQPQFAQGTGEFQALGKLAVQLGGQYDYGKISAGFMFKDRDAAVKFAGAVRQGMQKPAPAAPPAEIPEHRKLIGPNEDVAAVLPQRFAAAFAAGESFPTILAARKYAASLSPQIDVTTPLGRKAIDEAIEQGVTLHARQIVEAARQAGTPPTQVFDALVDLYKRQPALNERNADSMRRQAFSTPAPLAYLASRLADVTPYKMVYEPTAGNGSLLIEADLHRAIVNEIDPARLAALRHMGFDLIGNVDAATSFPPFMGRKVDVVLANPPFGKVRDDRGAMQQWQTPDYRTHEVDHAIVFKSLEALKDDGRAVLLIGGKPEIGASGAERRKAFYRSDENRAFFKSLYDRYNVVDHFTVDGDLYNRQGAGWPIDVIRIEGRGKSDRPLPMVETPHIYKTFDELKEKLHEGERPGAVGATEQRPDNNGRPGAAGPTGLGPVSGPNAEPGGGHDQSGGGGRGEPDLGGNAAGPLVPEPTAGNVGAGSDGGRGTGPNGAGGTAPDERIPGGNKGSEPSGETSAGDNGGEPGGVADPRRPEGTGLSDDELDAFNDIFGGGEAPKAPETGPAPSGDRSGSSSGERGGADTEKPPSGGWRAGFGSLYEEPEQFKREYLPGVDPQRYEQALPHFIEAVKELGYRPGEDIRPIIAKLGQELRAMGFTPDRMTAVRDDALQFMADLKTGRVRLDTPDEITPKEAERAAESQRTENKEVETKYQVRYEPGSNATAVGTLVPVNMQTAITHALDDLEARVGNIDRYVAEKLGYTEAQIVGSNGGPGSFSAEQIDAIALMIDNLDQGGGFIIGDQTGVGKGRTVAAMIRYAMRTGRTPIFFTQSPGLYADMYRDLRDIGMTDFKALVTNTNLIGSKRIPLEAEGEYLESLPPGRLKMAFGHINRTGTLPPGFDAIFTTYSQVQGDVSANRRQLLLRLAPHSLVVMDESHEAGGTETRNIDKATGQPVEGRAQFARTLLSDADGAIYSSATYAKNPHVMSLYFKTDMPLAVDGDVNRLTEIIKDGGVPLQQIIANMLTEAGQYVRRERSFDGVEFKMGVVQSDPQMAERASEMLRRIFQFDQLMEHARAAYSDHIAGAGDVLGADNAVGHMGAEGVGFAQIMHNVIGQSLLALKARQAVDEAKAAHARGEKPIIALDSTFGALLNRYMEENSLKHGDDMSDLTFNRVYRNYLQRTREVTIKHPFDEDQNEQHYITDKELRDIGYGHLVDEFHTALHFVENTDLSNMPASPLDHIQDELRAAGIRIGEITGRQNIIEDGSLAKRDPSQAAKKNAMNAFNAGDLDSLLINRSGSTGFSLHASSNYRDQRPRHMILLQPSPNIDTFMQILGRIHRTGQVELPKYTMLVSDLPAEKRPAANLMRKLGSLNANTSANKESAISLQNVTDIFNKYGDQVVGQLLNDDPAIANYIGVKQKADGGWPDGVAAKATGRLAILPIPVQEEFWARIDQNYNDLIDTLNRTGQNSLEAKTLDLDAHTLESKLIAHGIGDTANIDSNSPFLRPAVLEKVDVMRLGKPMTMEEIGDRIAKTVGVDDVGNPEHTWGDLPHEWKEEFAREKGIPLRDIQHGAGYESGSEKIQDWHRWLREKKGWQPFDRDQVQEHTNTLTSDLYNGTQKYLEKIGADLDEAVRVAEELKAAPKDDNDESGNKKQKAVEKAEARVARIQDQIKRINDQRHLIESMLEQHMPGAPVMLTAGTGESADNFHGVMIGISPTGKTANPSALSGWLAHIAIADGSREVRVPLSQFGSGDATLEKADRVAVKASFDEGHSSTREVRHIITGNLVRGFNTFNGKGQFIMFRRDDGTIVPGIMLPRKLDAEAELAKQPVRLSVDQAFDFIDRVKAANGRSGVVHSSDGLLRMQKKETGNEYLFSVTNRGGGQYYKPKAVNELLGILGQFSTRKGDKNWFGTAKDRATAEKVLTWYEENLDAKFEAREDKEHARPSQEGGTELSEPSGEFEKPGKPGELNNLNAQIDRWTKDKPSDANSHHLARDWLLERGANTGHEHAVLVDGDGKILQASTKNLPNQVALFNSPAVESALTDFNANLTFHHNHPGGRSQSPGDVSALGLPGVKMVVAHAQNNPAYGGMSGAGGDLFTTQLTPQVRQWADSKGLNGVAQVQKTLSTIAREVYTNVFGNLSPHVAGDAKAAHEADAIHADMVNRALDAAGLIHYVSSRDSMATRYVPRSAMMEIIRDGARTAMQAARENGLQLQSRESLDARINRSTRSVSAEEGMASLFGEARSGKEQDAGGQGSDRVGEGNAAPQGETELNEPPGAFGTAEERKKALDRNMVTTDKNLKDSARALVDSARDRGLLKAQQSILDKFTGLAAAEKAKNGGKLLPGATSPTLFARLARNHATVTDFWVNHGQGRFNPDTGVIEQIAGAKGLTDILKPIAGLGRTGLNDFKLWLMAQRADKLRSEGREKNMSDEDIDGHKNLSDLYQRPDGSNPFLDAQKQLRDWNKSLLDLGEATGLINKRSRALFEHDQYVPFFRALDDAEGVKGPKSGTGGPGRVYSPIRQLKGGEAKVNDIFENLVMNAQSLIRRSMENEVMRRTADHLSGTETLVPMSKDERARYEAEAAAELFDSGSALSGAGMHTDLIAAAREEARGLFTALRKKDTDVVRFLRDGVPVYYRVKDELLLRSLLNVGPQGMGAITRVLAGPARLLRAAVIFDPAFAAAHNVRLAQHAFVLTGVNPFGAMGDALRGWRMDPVALKMMAAGAISGRYDIDLPRNVRMQIEDPTYQRTLLNTPLKAAQFLKHVSERAMRASDIGPRMAVYEKAIRDGMGEAEALDRARDLLDFSTHGDGTAATFLAQTIPFLNARWQGLSRTGRGLLGEDRNAILMRGALLTAATMALWMENKDKPEWKRLEDWDKQYAYQFFVDGVQYRLPKAWEISALFSTIPEILLDYMNDGNTKHLQQAAISQFGNVFKFNPVPVAIRPVLEAYMNHDMFTGRPIVSPSEQSLVPDQQYGPGTSPAIVAATQVFNSVSPTQVAPDMMQHLVQGYLAGWGGYMASAADWLGDQAGMLHAKATPRATDYPIIGRFAHESPAASNRIQTDFYDLKTQIDQVGRSIDAARKNGDAETVKWLQSSHPEYNQAVRAQLDSAGKVLSQRRQILKRQEMNPMMTGEAKRKAIDDFNTWRDQYMDRLAPMIARQQGASAP